MVSKVTRLTRNLLNHNKPSSLYLRRYVHILNEFKPSRVLDCIDDISYAHENVPISCVNSLDKEFPVYVEYSTERIPKTDVHINTDTDFLTCCDCKDDCSVRKKSCVASRTVLF